MEKSKKQFNIDSYRKEIAKQIAAVEEEMRNTPSHLRRTELADEYEDLCDRLDPKFMCEYCYSDRHAYEVLRVEAPKRMVIRQLNAKRVNIGEYYMSDAQEYEFSSNPKAPEVVVRLHKNGRWYEKGNCNPFGITHEPHEYFDFSF